MAYRLMVLGGEAAQPANNTYVVADQPAHRHDRPPVSAKSSTAGSTRSPEEAKAAASQRGAGFEAVGLTPWQPAFSVPAIAGLKSAAEFRDPNQKANERRWSGSLRYQ